MAVALAAVLAALRRQSAGVRYLAACGAMALAAAAPAITFRLLPAASNISVVAPSSGIGIQPVESRAGFQPVAQVGNLSYCRQPGNVPEGARGCPAANRVCCRGRPMRLGPDWRQRAAEAVQPLLPWCVAAWLGGVILLSIWHAGGWLAAAASPRRGGYPGRRLDGSRAAVVGASGAAARRATSLVGGGPRALCAGLAQAGDPHAPERAGLPLARRNRGRPGARVGPRPPLGLPREPAANGVGNAPLLSSGRVVDLGPRGAERENCCDDLAVAACGNRRVYAGALAMLAQLQVPAISVPAASGWKLLPRIRRIVGVGPDHAPRRASWLPPLLALAVLAAIGSFMLLGGARAGDAKARPAKEAAAQNADPARPKGTQHRPVRRKRARHPFRSARSRPPRLPDELRPYSTSPLRSTRRKRPCWPHCPLKREFQCRTS